jgi:hypothetical protein
MIAATIAAFEILPESLDRALPAATAPGLGRGAAPTGEPVAGLVVTCPVWVGAVGAPVAGVVVAPAGLVVVVGATVVAVGVLVAGVLALGTVTAVVLPD